MSPEFAAFEQAVRQGKLVALATVLDGPLVGRKLLLWPDGRSQGTLGDATADEAVRRRAAVLFSELRPERLAVESAAGPMPVFIDVQTPQPRLFIVGAVHAAVALVTFARVLGFRTLVLDSRTAFATPARFGHADALVARWPADVLAASGLDATSYVVTLTHDEKIDTPALAVAVHSPARYVGALGSSRTHARRADALRAMGLSEAEIARIHAPIGLDIGARRPEEVALAIMAEIVAVANGVVAT